MNIQKPITAKEAHDEILDSLNYLRQEIQECELLDKMVPHFVKEIDNISMEGIIELYKFLNYGRKRLIMPHEMDCNFITVIWNPFPGCIIALESEKVSKVKIKLQKFNLN